MTNTALAESLFESLGTKGMAEAEVFLKSGRSRRFEVGSHGRLATSSQEEGWAVRASSDRASFFVAATGRPEPDQLWPEPDGQPLRLPAAAPVPAWKPPADLAAPLTGEAEAIALLEAIERRLSQELAGARLLRGVLEEGSSETEILNSRGVEATYRSRAAALYVEATGPWPGCRSVSIHLSRREARSFQPSAVAHRLADRLLLRHEGSSPRRDRGEMLLGPSIGGRLLAGLLPLFVGAGAEKLARTLHDRSARIGSRWLTVIDNGRFPGGVLEAPVDGEGAPTREVLLVEEGRYRQPLLSWRRRRSHGEASGCVRRAGWRDLPIISPSHLYLAPNPEVKVAELLAGVSRGYYLIDAPGAGEFDLENDRFRLPVSGFALRQGKAVSPLAGAELVGSISGWLRGVQARARDLEFRPLAGMLGSPTTLVTGLELRQIST